MSYNVVSEDGKLLAVAGEMWIAQNLMTRLKKAYYIKDDDGMILRTRGSVKAAETKNRNTRFKNRKNTCKESEK